MTTLHIISAILVSNFLMPDGSHSANSLSAPSRQGKEVNSRLSSRIRAIDFANFTYPGDPIFGKRKYRLQNREFAGDAHREPVGLFHISYGDLTRDGIEEAIVSLVVIVQGGTARPHIHYIYTIDKTKPKLLWMFNTGDRADGGLRQIYAEKGLLVVERYNSAKSTCCPVTFTRFRYRWNGHRFRSVGKREILPHPEGYGFPITNLLKQ
jgi:hypothetical protein